MFAQLFGGNLAVVIIFLILVSLPFAWGLSLLIRRVLLHGVQGYQQNLQSQSPWPVNTVNTHAIAANLPPSQAQSIIDLQDSKENSVLQAYALAGGIYAFFSALIQLAIYQSPLNLPKLLALSLVFAWPMILSYWQLTSASIREKWRMTLVYGFLLLGMGVFFGVGPDALLILWMGSMGVPSLLLLCLSHRLLRSIGHFVFPLVLSICFGMNLAFSFSRVAWGVPLSLLGGIFLILGCAVVSWRGLQRLINQYIHQRYSDRMLLIDAWWLTFSVWNLCLFVAYSDSIGTQTGYLGIVSFLVYRVSLRYWLKHKIMKPVDPPRRLLWLRAFDRQQQSPELLDLIGNKWRSIGPIQMIAGADLVGNVLEPHQLQAFLRGRLAQQFIHSLEQFEHQVQSIDLFPAPDGQYRISQFFCLNTNWKYVFNHLLPMSHTVLMDLRGFDASRKGVRYELETLFETVSADGFVILVDELMMDIQRTILQETWSCVSHRSANFNRPLSELQLIPYTTDKAQEIFERLCRSVEVNGLIRNQV